MHALWLPGKVSSRAYLGMESRYAFIWGCEWTDDFYPSPKATKWYGNLRMKAVRSPLGRDARHSMC